MEGLDEARGEQIPGDRHRIGSDHRPVGIELFDEAVDDLAERQSLADQRPDPRTDAVQRKVGLALEVEQHGLAIELLGDDAAGMAKRGRRVEGVHRQRSSAQIAMMPQAARGSGIISSPER